MNVRSWLMAACLGVTLGLAACGSPCDKLAGLTCEKVGAGDPRCAEAQARAERAGSAERAACARVLKMYEALVD